MLLAAHGRDLLRWCVSGQQSGPRPSERHGTKAYINATVTYGGNCRPPRPQWPLAARQLRGTRKPACKASPTNPQTLVNAITPEDIQAVVQRLIKKAKGGDVASAKVLFDRAVGPAAALDVDLRLTELESQVLGMGDKGSDT